MCCLQLTAYSPGGSLISPLSKVEIPTSVILLLSCSYDSTSILMKMIGGKRCGGFAAKESAGGCFAASYAFSRAWLSSQVCSDGPESTTSISPHPSGDESVSSTFRQMSTKAEEFFCLSQVVEPISLVRNPLFVSSDSGSFSRMAKPYTSLKLSCKVTECFI